MVFFVYMENTDKDLLIFRRIVPPAAADYCLRLWRLHAFVFKITQPRKSKYGDYRYNPADQSHQITVNGNLHPYAFLITYLHEVAHLVTQKEYGRKALPHGIEWKKNFSLLLEPVLNKEVFPLDILFELENYAVNPKATSCSDHELSYILHKYDPERNQQLFLKDLKEGERFLLDNRIFVKGELRRTRVLCTEASTKRKYLVSNMAPIQRMP